MTPWHARAAATALVLPLAGCVNMSGLDGDSRYACAAPTGVACDSVSGTYANAVRNNLPGQRPAAAPVDSMEPLPLRTHQGPGSTTTLAAAAALLQANPAMSPTAAGSNGRPAVALRSQSRVLRLWTKPWEDADGDLWDQGYVYVQVDAGRWQIDHVRQRIRDQYAPLRPPANTSAAPAAARGQASPETPADETDVPTSSGAGVQRPSAFSSFPSLVRPSNGPGTRPQ